MTSKLPKKYCDPRELRSSARPKRQEYATHDSRARLAGQARRGRFRGPKFEVFGTSNPELRTSDRAFLACLALHAPRPVALADFFSIPLETLLLPPPTVNRFRQAFIRPIRLTTVLTSEKYTLICQCREHPCDQPCGASLPSPSWSDSSTSLAMPSIRFTSARHVRQRARLVRSLRPSPSGLTPPVYACLLLRSA